MEHRNVEYSELEAIAEATFGSLGALAEAMGKNKQFFYTYKNRGEFGKKVVRQLEEFGINPERLRTGDKDVSPFTSDERGMKLAELLVKGNRSRVREFMEDFKRAHGTTGTVDVGLMPPNARNIRDLDMVEITLYKRKVNAGVGIDLDVKGERRVLVPKLSAPHPDITFALDTSGESMSGVGIVEDTMLICERIPPDYDRTKLVGKIVIAGYEGAVYVKRLVFEDGKYLLRSEHPDRKKYKDMEINDYVACELLAVVKKAELSF